MSLGQPLGRRQSHHSAALAALAAPACQWPVPMMMVMAGEGTHALPSVIAEERGAHWWWQSRFLGQLPLQLLMPAASLAPLARVRLSLCQQQDAMRTDGEPQPQHGERK